jgi:hypothetical protein
METRDQATEVFAEISLFEGIVTDNSETGDCGCVGCDGNPCVK